MAKTTLQLRRGTQSENSTFTGALGEVVVDTTRKTLVVHDGTTVGGSTLATLDSPALTGTPTAPKATYGDNTTKLATTSFVHDAIAGFSAGPTSSDDVTEGTTNLYFTKDHLYTALTATGDISISQPGGPGTNVRISYTTPTNISAFTNDAHYLTSANITASLSVIDASGQLQYDPGTGIFTFTQTVASVNGLTGTVVLNSDNISDVGRTNKWASSSTVRGYLAAGTGLTYTSGSGTFALTNTSINLGGNTISLTSGTLQAFNTDNVSEGTTNKYFSNTLARGAFSNGTGVTITNGQVAIGQAVGTSDSVSFANVTATTNLTVNTSLIKTDATNTRVGINNASPSYTLDVAGDVNFTGKLRLSGSTGTNGYVLLSGGLSASPTWANIADSLPEVIELDKFRDTRTAQSTWYGFINGTTFTDPYDANNSQGTGTFTKGMYLTPSSFISNGLAASGSLSYTASISGTTMTVTTQPVLGNAVASTSFASGGTSGSNTIVMTASNSTNATYVAGVTVTATYSSGGGTGLKTFTVSTAVGIVTGASITGTNVPAGTIITDVNYLTNVITISNLLSGTPSGSYTILINYGAPGTNTFYVNSVNNVFIGQTVTGTGIPSGTTVTGISGTLVTISTNLQAQAAGTYTFQFSGVAGVQAGQTIIGYGIPVGTTVLSVTASTLTVTLSQNLTDQATGFYTYYSASSSISAGMGVTAQAYQAGNILVPNTYIVGQLTSNTTAVTQLTYSSGGASSATTIVFTSVTSAAVGQLISGTGVPTGTFITKISGLTVTISKALTQQAAGTYNVYTAGSVGTYQVSQSQTITTMTVVSGVVTFSLDSIGNADLDGITAPYQQGQQITVTGVQPSIYNGSYIVTGCTASTVSVASVATGTLISNGYLTATMNGRCEITSVNSAVIAQCTINGATLTINSLVSGSISVGQAVYVTGQSNLYIVSGAGLVWTLNKNVGNLGTLTNITATSYTVFPSQSIQATLINGASKPKDGGNAVFAPTTNGSSVTVTYPIQLQIQKNGLQLDPWLNNSGSVWQNLTPFGDYTVDSNGNIVFATPPQVADNFIATVLVGRSTNPIVKTYPFRPIDIMIGT